MESAAVLALVGLAAAFLAGRAWRTFAPRKTPGGCGCAGTKVGCPAASEAVRRVQEAVRSLNRG